jgi:hypothetical protein
MVGQREGIRQWMRIKAHGFMNKVLHKYNCDLIKCEWKITHVKICSGYKKV